MLIELNSLRFGIPLRSHINHKFFFKTADNKGLDFSKALLLLKDEYISSSPFMIPAAEFVKIKDAAHIIQRKFSKYVGRYVEVVAKQDRNVLERNYKFSTLRNYHLELGL